MSSPSQVCLHILAAVGLATSACGESGGPRTIVPDGPTVRFDPTLSASTDNPALDWLAFPFPSDLRRTATNTIDLSTFPNPDNGDTLNIYTSYGTDHLDGFGTNAPVYMSFPVPLDVSDLPTTPAGWLDERVPIALVDITPSSPEYGQRRPLRFELFEVDGKFVAPNTLAVAPAWGFPLRERTTYALVITDDLPNEGDDLAPPTLLTHVLTPDSDLTPEELELDPVTLAAVQTNYAPLAKWLEKESIAPDTIIAATVFTTQTITRELAAIYDHLHQTAPPSAKPDGWQELGGAGVYHLEKTYMYTDDDEVEYYVLEGRYDSPNYQVGDIPYATEGGHFNFEGTTPTPTHTETLRFRLTVPTAPPVQGDCYPIVEYAHGTGGSATGFTDSTAGRLAARGLAGIGIDQPLHGTRWSGSSSSTSVSLYTFNLINPAAARTMFRQSAVDTFALTRLLRQGLTVPEEVSPTHEAICFDPERVFFFGHSQGGLSGSLAAAFEGDIDAWVLSGAGGGLSITMVERDDELFDVQQLLTTLLTPHPDEVLSEMHPILGLVQLLSEITDPINYAPYWSTRDDYHSPTNILVTSGELDAATPHRTAAAMAVAARIPAVEPVQLPVWGYEAAGVSTVSAPVLPNQAGVTQGFMQWAHDTADPTWSDHFVIFNRPEAIHASMRFLQSAAFEEGPTLERDPSTDAR